jgi:hypothetical protein
MPQRNANQRALRTIARSAEGRDDNPRSQRTGGFSAIRNLGTGRACGTTIAPW